MEILAVAGSTIESIVALASEPTATEGGGFQINFFWVIVQALSFLLFLVILYLVAFRRIGDVLETRRATIEQGLQDAEAAKHERARAASERDAVINEARREAQEIVSRAQRVAEEARERETTATRTELDRLRERAAAEIEAERQRALADVRSQVADLALYAAGRVVGETMSEPRERRLVEEFLQDVGGNRPSTGTSSAGSPA